MTTPAATDRLYALLPAIDRMRDAEHGYPLRALLRVIEEQVNVVDADITQLYENWFIETAQDWAVAYIGDLLGYEPATTGLTGDATGCEPPRALVPRREIANLVRHRRRKGTLALLEELAAAVSDWPARAVEFYRLLGRAQHVNHLWPNRHRLADLRDVEALDLLDGPFDSLSHTVDVRRIQSRRTRGRTNIPSVGLHAWRLRSYPVTDTPAFCVEESGPHCFTFSVLGQDAPLFVRPEPETEPTHIAEELNVPAAIRRLAFDRRPADLYGPGLSMVIRAEGWAGYPSSEPVPVSRLLPADLTDWVYVPPPGHISVDPVLGRLAFPPGQLPKKGVRVSYRYGFPADLGGGEYHRTLLAPAGEATLYRVGPGERFTRLTAAFARWQAEQPERAVIELATSGVYVEPVNLALAAGQRLQIRAAVGARPVLRMIDWQTDQSDAFSVVLARDSRLTLDGLLVTGRPVQLQGDPEASPGDEGCLAEVVIRHCTLVPGWAIEPDCGPKRPSEPSLELINVPARVRIEHSIVGSILVQQDAVRSDPMPIEIDDSIVDSTGDERVAMSAPGGGPAHAELGIRRSTVFGIVEVKDIRLAENSIFTSCVNVVRRQRGCVRFSYVPQGCRTPRRYRCQPDGVFAAVRERLTDPTAQAAEIEAQTVSVRPQFTAVRYGLPAYAQLAVTCADEITRGADDGSEMGVYHDLYQPQREQSLATRLEEYTPAGMDVAIVFVN